MEERPVGERPARLLDAGDAAARLGVKRETLYAYVSRGMLSRHPSSSGRSSWFDAAEVDRLRAERGTRRPSGRFDRSAGGGLDVAISSAVTTIGDGRVSYRGHDLADLVGPMGAMGGMGAMGAMGGGERGVSRARVPGAPATPYEAVAELLWSGSLPTERPHWAASPPVAAATRRVLDALPSSARPADRLRVATAASAAVDPMRVDLRPAAVCATARGLIVVLADALGTTQPQTADLGPHEGVAGRAAAALGADARWWGVIDTALVTLADHELATSTLAARVAASTRADPYQMVLAGLAAMSGPLHGSASARVGRLLRAAEEPGGPEPAIAEQLRELGAVPGFGQSQYPTGDPRAPLLLGALRQVVGAGGQSADGEAVGRARRALEVADAVAAAVAQRAAIAPNVDFALATLLLAAGLPYDVGEALFALARVAGWVAHGLEEYAATPLRYRLRAVPGAAVPPGP